MVFCKLVNLVSVIGSTDTTARYQPLGGWSNGVSLSAQKTRAQHLRQSLRSWQLVAWNGEAFVGTPWQPLQSLFACDRLCIPTSSLV